MRSATTGVVVLQRLGPAALERQCYCEFQKWRESYLPPIEFMRFPGFPSPSSHCSLVQTAPLRAITLTALLPEGNGPRFTCRTCRDLSEWARGKKEMQMMHP